MNTHKLLASLLILVSCFLYSCSCEDVYLGSLTETGQLNNFLPNPDKEGIYKLQHNDKLFTMGYNVHSFAEIKVPVSGTGSSGVRGKGATYDCVEYYNMQEKEYLSFTSTGGSPVLLFVKRTKNINPDGFTSIAATDQVEDVIQFGVGFNNVFPNTITRGMMNYDNFMTYRYFTLSKNPDKLLNKKNSFTQELLPSITLNGVAHQNVYHLALTAPQYTEDEKYFNNYYPLEYIQGIYVKEGVGILQAYTSNGQKVDIRKE